MYLRPRSPCVFPDPRRVDSEGLVAYGGDLSAERLVAAYANGIFPWYEEGVPPLWWSPDPRGVMEPGRLHVSRSLRRSCRRGSFRLTWNQVFERVMRECSAGRPDGTWIIPEMFEAYARLHRMGNAHSLEVWAGESLVGGLYGVQVGGLFAAESMFHSRTDASKVALAAAVHSLFEAGVGLFDVQFLTTHLAGMGAFEVSRDDYLERLVQERDVGVDLRKLELGFPN